MRPSAFRERAHSFCAAVESTRTDSTLVQALDNVKATLSGTPGEGLVVPLCKLVELLLRGVPARLTRDGVALLLDLAALNEPQTAAARAQILLIEASPLCVNLLIHPNRAVRSYTLQLLAILAPHVAALQRSEVAQLARRPLLGLLCEVIGKGGGERGEEDGLLAAVVLRALCRSPHGLAVCGNEGQGGRGLLALLQDFSPLCWQGALGVAISELQLRLGWLGKQSELGSELGAALLGLSSSRIGKVNGAGMKRWAPGESATEDPEVAVGEMVGAGCGEVDDDTADAAMVWSDGKELLLHRIILAVRAPQWNALLAEHTTAVHGSVKQTRKVCSLKERRFTEKRTTASDYGALQRVEDQGTPTTVSRVTKAVWSVDISFSHAACTCLYQYVVTGAAPLPEGVSPKVLTAAAEHLGMQPMLFAPPNNPSGTPWLQVP